MTFNRHPPSADRFDGCQNDLLEWMDINRRKFGDIFQACIHGTSAYVVSEPRYADYVLRKNWRNYKKGHAIIRVSFLLGRGLMVSEGEFWKRQRRMVQPAFRNDMVDGFTNTIVKANSALLARWKQAAQNAESVNVTRDISAMVLEITLKVIFGDDYQQVASRFGMLSDEPVRDLKFARAFRSLGSPISQVVAARRREDSIAPDMLGILMNARDRDSGPRMSEGQLINEIMTLIVAGHETTASTLNWIWYLLARNPEVEKKLNEEIIKGPAFSGIDGRPEFAYTRQVIEETLRLYPAGWLMTRRAQSNDKLGDYFVPAGTEIYLSPYIIQRHPNFWKDPTRFDPDRFSRAQLANQHPLAMLAFSAGPRNCIGENLARLEMLIHMKMLAGKIRLRHLKREPAELDLGVNLRSKHDFIMVPTSLT